MNNEDSSYSIEYSKNDNEKVNFWKKVECLYFGYANDDSDREFPVVYNGYERRNETSGFFSSIKLEHVLCIFISNEDQKLALPKHWKMKWILYSQITPHYKIKLSSIIKDKEQENSLEKAIYNYFLKSDILSNDWELPRKARIPASIRAWAEKENKIDQLDQYMPLDDEGTNRFKIPVDEGDEEKFNQKNLELKRVRQDSEFYKNFVDFLEKNASQMPGTMDKAHELRSEKSGGKRAKLGKQWLATYDKNGSFDTAEIIAITGVKVKNIFVNYKTPTWLAYNENTINLITDITDIEKKQETLKQDEKKWSPSQSLPNIENWKMFTNPRLGEFYLFHGTALENIINICYSGLDPEYVNYSSIKGYGKTGYGTAFTDQFAKALAYSPPEINFENEDRIYSQYVLFARVFAGNYYYADDRARRTRGNLELTRSNINYEQALGNMPKAQGQGKLFLGQSSESVEKRLKDGEILNSTLQQRRFELTINKDEEKKVYSYLDTSLTISAAIQMYPMFIIECEIPKGNISTAVRTLQRV